MLATLLALVSLTTDVQLRNLIVFVLEHLVEFLCTSLTILVILVNQQRPQDQVVEALNVVSASFCPCLAFVKAVSSLTFGVPPGTFLMFIVVGTLVLGDSVIVME